VERRTYNKQIKDIPAKKSRLKINNRKTWENQNYENKETEPSHIGAPQQRPKRVTMQGAAAVEIGRSRVFTQSHIVRRITTTMPLRGL
jgi:hypothetical protein